MGGTHLNLTGIIIGIKAHDTAPIDKIRYVYIKNIQSCHTIKELPEESDPEESGSTDLFDSIERCGCLIITAMTRTEISKWPKRNAVRSRHKGEHTII